MKKVVLILLVVFLAVTGLVAQIDSQWRGDTRNGFYNDTNLLKLWPADGPELLWSVEDLGAGHSSPVVTKDGVYVTHMIDGKGYISAFDLNGKLLWKETYGAEWDGDFPGARTTPTVIGNKFYFVSGRCVAHCFDVSTRKNVWTVDLEEKFGAVNLRWGMTESPLIFGDNVIVTPGGPDVTIAALNKNTGETIWKTNVNGETSSYCSPQLVDHNGLKMIVTMTQKSLIAVDAKTGAKLWIAPHETAWDVNPNTPYYQDGYVYSVSGYGTGGAVFKLSDDGKNVTEVWKNKHLDSQMGSAIVLDGYIYGSGMKDRGWQCLDFKTGEQKYNANELGRKGNVIFADGMLYCYSEKGDVGLVKPSPEKFEVISSFPITLGTDQHWAHPVIKHGRLFVRHGSALMVYNISK